MDPTKLAKERRELRQQLDNALQEDEDPLAAYDHFVKWTVKNYAHGDAASGLRELLEEATGKFKDDLGYKSDLRYLKLWCQYARMVDPLAVFHDLMQNDIGERFALLYEDYAKALDAAGRQQDADRIYRRGIKRNARPVERLKKHYKEFQAGLNTVRPPPPSKTPPALAAPRDPFLHIHAPADPRRRPERLRFNLSLLLTEDGTEYCAAEARARSMGLLGKKWAPDPGPSGLTNNSRKSVGMRYEPTVTINTKEALADVFGMYNSPEKTLRIERPGSKHAPVTKIELRLEPLTPAPSLRFSQSDENASAAKTPAFKPFVDESTTPAFKPFVDENAARKENTTPAPRFKPFVDTGAAVTPANIGRGALYSKDFGAPTPSSAHRPRLVDKSKGSVLQPVAEDGGNPNVFSKVFTPKSSPKDVFSDNWKDPIKPETPVEPVPAAVFQAPGATFAAPVFSRPPEPAFNVFTPKSALFTPFVDTASAQEAPRAAFGEKTPSRLPPMDSHRMDDGAKEEEEESYQEEDYREESASNESAEAHSPDVEYAVPMGGRFGQFNVMTPITERTYDFTMSTRGMPTPGDDYAVEAAERLAAELREEEARGGVGEQQRAGENGAFDSSFAEFDDEPARPNFGVSDGRGIPGDVDAGEERTGAMSMMDTLTVLSSFKPSNPCNPFDGPVVSALLSQLPSSSRFYDMQNEEASLLDGLQKFAQKKARQSGNTSSRGALSDAGFALTISDRQFTVSDKLGEGGFGAVFAATEATEARDDEESFIEDDEDEDGAKMVAIKVVKPRNLWEFHILQRVHRALPPHLRQSVVLPHALYAYRDESFLILDLCPQGTLLDTVNRASQIGVSQQGACLDELLVMFFAIELLRFLEGMHSTGFIHGDLKIDNCLLRLEEVPGGSSGLSSIYSPMGEQGWSYKGIKVIDFGRTIDTGLFPAGQEFVADWPIDAKDCLEMREGRPWTYQADYYGLAGVIYCLLFGKYIEASSVTVMGSEDGSAPRLKVATPFKRYWQSAIWSNLFDMLLNSGDVRPGGALPLCGELGAVRKEMESWLQANCNRSSGTLKGMLRKIELSVYSG
ncbi:hypothetical protein FIBSPDRAFT_822968 [Athelia psychrophila]|uniref:Kinase-like protein n=2 Tax=Athelia psychrophila TaxID=1759441 RepID=A0A166MAZ3_9AGAM|nr:hypothetical protein FIBSPDRAFT_822968 [Fibularhizoctonia sp. CBS 109695]